MVEIAEEVIMVKRTVLLLLLLSLTACGPTVEPTLGPPTRLPSPSPTGSPRPRTTASPYPPPASPHGMTPEPTPASTPYPEHSPSVVSSPVPTPEPTAVLYFLSDRGGQVDLWRLDPAGGGVERRTDDPVEERWPVPSPDGLRLAYVALEEAQAVVRLLDLSSGKGQVVEGSGSAEIEPPQWLDAARLLYRGRVSTEEMAFFVVPVPGPAQRLTLEGLPEGTEVMDWSAAGERIVLQVGDPGRTSDLYLAEVAADGTMVLGRQLVEGYDPLLSPAGRRLLYKAPAYDDDPAGYLFDIDTGETTSYNEDAPLRRWDHDLAWAPAGDQFAFARSSWAWTGEDGRPFYVGEAPEPSASGGEEGLYRAGVAGGEVGQLTDFGYDTAPAWSGDGRFLVFVSNREVFDRSDLWLLDRTSGALRMLTGAEGNDWAPRWAVP